MYAEDVADSETMLSIRGNMVPCCYIQCGGGRRQVWGILIIAEYIIGI